VIGRDTFCHIRSGCEDRGGSWGRTAHLPLILWVLYLLIAHAAWAQQTPLQQILSRMDQTAASFQTTQATFVWDQYQKVVDETDTQKGTVYFRRARNEVQMAADIIDPTSPKYVLFTDSKVEVYQPRIDQVTRYNTGKDRSAFESFLVLGFGGSGQEMLKSFGVTYIGTEKVGGVDTAKLELVPKSQKVRNTFDHIWLWIDPLRGVSVQQQLFAPSGDYRLAKYSDIQLNQKIPEDRFKLKTTGKTKVVSPQG
jgi:outer membrane lipoprotein-sorting protein